MYRTKLIKHLKQFTKNEMVRFGHYLDSPFFFRGKKEDKLISLFHHLQRYHPTFDHKNLDKRKVFAQLFEGKEYNEQALQQLTTKFNKALKGFIRHTYQEQSFGFPLADFGLANFYEQKEMLNYFEQLHDDLSKTLEAKAPKAPEKYWMEFLLSKNLTDHQSRFNIRHTDLNLPSTLSRLDYFFIVLKLDLACAFLNQAKHHLPLESDGSLESLRALLPMLQNGHFREDPLIDLLYRTYLLLQGEASETEFRELKKHYDQQAMKIGLLQRSTVHGAMRNYCSMQINAGNENYLEELLSLYQDGLPQEVLYAEGGLTASAFQNMVTIGLRLERYEWVEEFLESHRFKVISLEEPESIYALYKANLLFATGEFEAALEQLTYNFKDTYFKLIARRLEIQIYYELESSILDSKIQAFKVFVFRTSQTLLTEVQQIGYTNFIDLLKQIIHPSTRFNQKRIKSLLSKLANKNTVAEKTWLHHKLQELEKT